MPRILREKDDSAWFGLLCPPMLHLFSHHRHMVFAVLHHWRCVSSSRLLALIRVRTNEARPSTFLSCPRLHLCSELFCFFFCLTCFSTNLLYPFSVFSTASPYPIPFHPIPSRRFVTIGSILHTYLPTCRTKETRRTCMRVESKGKEREAVNPKRRKRDTSCTDYTITTTTTTTTTTTPPHTRTTAHALRNSHLAC
ncbi:hypothetical protein IWZ00DRAFT_182261 [Phyllosticta capitalensis]